MKMAYEYLGKAVTLKTQRRWDMAHDYAHAARRLVPTRMHANRNGQALLRLCDDIVNECVYEQERAIADNY